MRWLLDRLAMTTALLLLLAMPMTEARAQYPGFGGPGYGYGYPGFGYGYPAYGNPGFGYPGLAPGYGLGYPAYAPGVYYGGPPITVAASYAQFGIYYGGTGPGAYNPLFGLGLTPLGVNSALAERSLLGRGTPVPARGVTRAPVPIPAPGPTTSRP